MAILEYKPGYDQVFTRHTQIGHARDENFALLFCGQRDGVVFLPETCEEDFEVRPIAIGQFYGIAWLQIFRGILIFGLCANANGGCMNIGPRKTTYNNKQPSQQIEKILHPPLFRFSIKPLITLSYPLRYFIESSDPPAVGVDMAGANLTCRIILLDYKKYF